MDSDRGVALTACAGLFLGGFAFGVLFALAWLGRLPWR